MILQNLYKGISNYGFRTWNNTNMSANIAWHLLSSSGSGDLIVGSGNTPVQYTDSSLESQINTLTKTNLAKRIGYGNVNCSFAATYRNDTSDPITVREQGIIANYYNTMLVAREVLDVPVVINPGEAHVFTMALRVNTNASNINNNISNSLISGATVKYDGNNGLSSRNSIDDCLMWILLRSYTSTSPERSYVFLDIGFGNTQVSKSDYVLADSNWLRRANNQPSLTIRTLESIPPTDEHTITWLMTTVTNDTNQEFIVRELGIAVRQWSADPKDLVLVARKVLSSPKRVLPGDTASFSFQLRFE